MSQDPNTLFTCSFCGRKHTVAEKKCPVEGKPIPHHHKLVGQVLENKYQVEGVLGEGGMGVVYRARHKLIGRLVAVKFLFPEIASEPEPVMRFYNEARTTAGIGHEHIIEVTDMGRHENGPYFVMEYLDGRTLAALLKGGRLPPAGAVGIALQILGALCAVHAKGVIHRDLKPENIFLITKSGRSDFVKILDFGVSKLKTPEAQKLHLTKTGTMLGTPYYMSPEQVRGMREVDTRTDLYSVGVILYEMLAARLPFEGANLYAIIAAILSQKPLPPSAHNPSVPPPLSAVVMRAIAREPGDRFQSASELTGALEPFASKIAAGPSRPPALSAPEMRGKSIATPAPGELEKAQVTDLRVSFGGAGKGTSPKTWVAAAAVAVAVVLAVSGFFIYRARTQGGGQAGVSASQGGPAGAEAAAGQAPAPFPIPAPGEKPASGASPLPIDGIPASPPSREAAPPGPAKAQIRVNLVGIPAEAVLLLDGKVMKGNPFFVEPSKETRTIRVEAAGYEPWILKRVIDSHVEVAVAMTKKTKEAAPPPAPLATSDGKAPGPPDTPAGQPPSPLVPGAETNPATQKPDDGPIEGEGGVPGYKGIVKTVTGDYPE